MWQLFLDPNFQLGICGLAPAWSKRRRHREPSRSLRGRSLLGDVLAHAALPGVCLAFMVTGSKEILPLLVGAGIVGHRGDPEHRRHHQVDET